MVLWNWIILILFSNYGNYVPFIHHSAYEILFHNSPRKYNRVWKRKSQEKCLHLIFKSEVFSLFVQDFFSIIILRYEGKGRQCMVRKVVKFVLIVLLRVKRWIKTHTIVISALFNHLLSWIATIVEESTTNLESGYKLLVVIDEGRLRAHNCIHLTKVLHSTAFVELKLGWKEMLVPDCIVLMEVDHWVNYDRRQIWEIAHESCRDLKDLFNFFPCDILLVLIDNLLIKGVVTCAFEGKLLE